MNTDDVNTRDDHGKTALMCAAQWGGSVVLKEVYDEDEEDECLLWVDALKDKDGVSVKLLVLERILRRKMEMDGRRL